MEKVVSMMAYESPKVLKFRSKTLFILSLLLKCCVLIYGLFYVILQEKGWAKGMPAVNEGITTYLLQWFQPSTCGHNAQGTLPITCPSQGQALDEWLQRFPYCNQSGEIPLKYTPGIMCKGSNDTQRTSLQQEACTLFESVGLMPWVRPHWNHSCLPLYGEAYAYANTIIIPSVKLIHPYSCAGNTSGNHCRRHYHTTEAYSVPSSTK